MTSSFTRKKIEGYSYGLNDVIGKGYSSHVYKGRHDENSQSVAIKVIDLRMLKNEINKILLQSQIQVLKELKSLDHILALHEVYTTKNNTYIITELCESDLNKTIKKGLNEAQVVSFMEQIISGYLNFARKNIIHRDLKPANILITSQQHLKIADFGFAIKSQDAAKSNKYNVGSPLYMAPESLKRNQYTLKTDIWALGVIFYEMLNGETPWRAKNEKQLIKKIESERIDDILLKLGISSISKQFLRRTLRIDKHSRMSLEQLEEFTFKTGSILTEKKLNVELRSININGSTAIMTPKKDKNENRLFIDRSNNQNKRGGSKDQSVNKFNSFRNQTMNHSIQLKPMASKYNLSFNHEFNKKENGKENPQSTQTQQTVRPSQLRQQKKSISKILVSEIHFCRFLFKLLSKISQSNDRGLLQHSSCEVDHIMKEYTAIIKHKIDNLVRFSTQNFISANAYEQYKESTDYAKLIKIAREYKERYSLELKDYWTSSSGKPAFVTNATLQMIQHLSKLLRLKEHSEGFVENCSREIVVLDYLITSKQLIELFKNGENYQRFSRKSRIEEIVEGKTADISKQLYQRIMSRAKDVSSAVDSFFASKLADKAMLAV